jgi:hypothetical protein
MINNEPENQLNFFQFPEWAEEALVYFHLLYLPISRKNNPLNFFSFDKSARI